MKRKKIAMDRKLPFKLTIRERDLIRDHTFYDSNFAELAVVDGNNVCVDLSLSEIEDIQGYAAAEANHTKSSKLEKELDEIFDRLQFYLDTYEVEHED